MRHVVTSMFLAGCLVAVPMLGAAAATPKTQSKHQHSHTAAVRKQADAPPRNDVPR